VITQTGMHLCIGNALFHRATCTTTTITTYHVPVFAQDGDLTPPYPGLWRCSLLLLSMICQPEPSHCAWLSTRRVWLLIVPLCRPDSLELAARWT